MMQRYFLLAANTLVAVSLAAMTGCGSSSTSANPPAKTTGEHFEGDGHDHSEDTGDHAGHDHELPSK